MYPFKKSSAFQGGYCRRRRSVSDRIQEELFVEWFGEDRAMLELESRQQPSRNIAGIVSELLISLDKDDDILLRELVDTWRELVGPEIQRHASPRQIKNGFLFIEVYEAPWRFHLEINLKPEIERIIQRVSNNRIKGIKFVTGGKTRYRHTK